MSVFNDFKSKVEELEPQFAKHKNGNNAAGTRARNLLSEITKLAKTLRVEILSDKEARKDK